MKTKNKLLSNIATLAVLLAAPLTPAVAQVFNIFPVSQTWSYMATPSDTTFCLNGTGWETVGYDDSGWPTGPGGFTGGENTAATLTSLAGLLNTTSLPAPTPSQGRPQYFRTHFNVASTNSLSLILSNRIDDQAVFYLNGTRVADYRHPNNPETCTPGGAGGDEATVWIVITLTPDMLANIIQVGDNLLAVSDHQDATGSSDMVFCCILSGTTAPPPPPVGPIAFTNGTGVITFDTAPPAQQWSTLTGTGGNANFQVPSDIDTAAKTNDASIINSALVSATGNPPVKLNQGVYAADAGAQYIQTCPTGCAYTRILATLTNVSGATVNSIGLRYQLTVRSAVAEELPGQYAYYSTTGTPGSWVQIPGINDPVNDNIDGTYPKSADIDLSATPWANNTKMYFLWVDDDGIAHSPDTFLDIDNVQFIGLTPTVPTFVNATDPTNRTVLQCASTTFSAGIATGYPTPTYQWYKTDVAHPIGGATSSSYTVASVQSGDAGVYFVRAVNSQGTAESHHATLTVTPPPTFATVSAVGSTNQTDILVSFNAQVDPNTVDPNGFDLDVHERGGGGSVGTASATVVNGTNVLVIAGSPMTAGVSYDVEFQNAGVGNTCTSSKVIGNVHVTASVYLLAIDATQMWRYNDSGVEPAAQGALTWIDPGWDDSAWPQGLAAFDTKRGVDRRTDLTYGGLSGIGITGTVVRTELTLTNAIYNFLDIPTYNFRTRLDALPYGVPNGLYAYSFFDDGGRVYINGNVAFTNRDDPTNVFAIYSNVGAISAETTYEGPFQIAPSVLHPDANVVAVEIKQVNSGSSDATMGLILVGLYDSFAPRLNASTDRGFQQTDLTWSSGTLQYNTNLSRGSGWHDVPGAVSPYTVYWSPGLGVGHAGGTNTLFFRLR